MSDKPSRLTIAGREFSSRLLLGTGKFSSNDAMRDALAASGTALVTVALRRADLSGKKDPFANILDFIDPDRYLLLPNTSGAMKRRRGRAPRAAGEGGGAAELGQAGDSSRPTLPAARSGRDVSGRRAVGKGGICRAAVHQRGPGVGQAIAGRGHRHGDAARRAHRQQPRPGNPRANWRSSSSRRRCRSWWTRDSAHRARPPPRWRWGGRRAGQHGPSPWRTIRCGWRGRFGWRSKPGAMPTRSGWARNGRPQARRVP